MNIRHMLDMEGISAAAEGTCLSKVPGLAVDVDAAAVDAVPLQGQLPQASLDFAHRLQEQVAHDVKAVGVYLRATVQKGVWHQQPQMLSEGYGSGQGQARLTSL